MTKFADVLEIKNGRAQHQVQNPSGKYPIYGSGGIMGYADDFICEANTVIIGRKGTINKPIFAEEPFWNVDTAFGLVANQEKLMPKYLYYFCERFDFEKLNTTVTIPSLTKANLLKIEIPLPPLATQQKIADILDRANALIEKRKAQIEKLDLLVKSQFVEMFGDPVTNPLGWEARTLQQLIDDGSIIYHLDGNHGELYPRTNEFIESGTPYIGANCIDNGEISFKNAKYLAKERADNFRKGVAVNNDVLFAHNATVGPVAILSTMFPKVILSTSLTSYRCDLGRLSPYYLRSYMSSLAFIIQYKSEMGQTTRNQVPITAQRKYRFLVPPLALQTQFAAFVERVEAQKAQLKKSLALLELNYKSLMQKCFSGEMF